MQLHVRASKRVLTLRDPYVNLLRNTVACYAAGLGGADAITSVPFDSVAGLPDAEADFVWGEDAWCYVEHKDALIVDERWNSGGQIPRPLVKRSLRLLCEEVMPAFR